MTRFTRKSKTTGIKTDQCFPGAGEMRGKGLQRAKGDLSGGRKCSVP